MIRRPPGAITVGAVDGRADRWFAGRRSARAAMVLFCFPHAGGGASAFATWRERLLPTVDVSAAQYPGREERLDETPFRAMSELIAALLDVFPRDDHRPFAFFGHSHGALVAYEMAHALRSAQVPGPAALIVSGCRSPEQRLLRRAIHTLPEPEFREALHAMDGTLAPLLEDERYMALISPGIRADFEMNETYRPAPRDPLAIPVLALAGTRDPLAPVPAVQGWQHHTAGAFELRQIIGAHLFVRDARDETLAAVRDFLRRRVCRPSSDS
jgi:medium-chain acyl-[acyl-carrier-protein] hydrolase